MKTLINDTIVTVDMMSFEEHTHDKLITPIYGRPDLEPAKPFRVAYITLKSNESYQPVKDKLTCLVHVVMTNDFRPMLEFEIAEIEEHDERNESDVGGFDDNFIHHLLHDLADGILYGEHDWKRNLYPN